MPFVQENLYVAPNRNKKLITPSDRFIRAGSTNSHMLQISPAELQQKLSANEDIVLIDVREPEEHEAFNIGGLLIPLPDIMSHASEIPKDKPVVLYCKMGIRSKIAIQRLSDKYGFTNLVNLTGGMEAWKKLFKV